MESQLQVRSLDNGSVEVMVTEATTDDLDDIVALPFIVSDNIGAEEFSIDLKVMALN